MVKRHIIALVLIVALSGYLLWILEDVGPHGALQKRLLQNKDLVADILPPPLYIVDSFLEMHQYFQSSESGEKKQILETIENHRNNFLVRQKYWEQADFLSEEADLQEFHQLLRRAEEAFQIFFEFVHKQNAGVDSRDTENVRRQILLTFKEHQKHVGKLVNQLNDRQASLLERIALGVRKYRFVIFLLMVVFALLITVKNANALAPLSSHAEQIWFPVLTAAFIYWVYHQFEMKSVVSTGVSDPWRILDIVFVGVVTVLVASLMRNRYLTMAERLWSSEKKYLELLQNYSREVVDRIEEERKRISRDLHDGIIQLLGSVKFRLEFMKGQWRRERVLDEADVDRSLEILQMSITDLRNLCYQLRPSILDRVGLRTAMSSLIEDYEAKTKIMVVADFEFSDDDLGEVERLALFRIFQEILANSEKYSAASEINLLIRIENMRLLMTVRDNGRGVYLDKNGLPVKTGLGLINIRERVKSLNGFVEFSSFPGQGFQVSIEIPNVGISRMESVDL